MRQRTLAIVVRLAVGLARPSTLLVGLLLAGGAAAPPAGAQPSSAKVHRVGVLLTTTPAAVAHLMSAFSDALRGLGHVEGQNLALEIRAAEGRMERLPELAADLVRRKVDVIVASANPSIEAARRASATTPIVMISATDPVAMGFVASLARPGGNLTGLSSQLTPEIRAKQLQLLREAVPRITRVGVLRNAARATPEGWKEYEAAGQAAGVRVQSVEVQGADALAKALAVVARERGAGLFVPGDPLFFTHRQRVVDLALEHRLPGVFFFREFTEAGGLMSYSSKLSDQVTRAAGYVDKILRGVRPGDLPVEQPIQFELVVNLRTARALGLALPQAFLLRADQVLE